MSNTYPGFLEYTKLPSGSGGGGGSGINSINGDTTSAQLIVAGTGITVDSPVAGTTRITNTATGGINQITSSDLSISITDDMGPITDLIINSTSILNTLLTGLIADSGRVLNTDTILEAFGKLSQAPTFTAINISSNGDTIIMGTTPNTVKFNILGVTGVNVVNFPGGNVTSTTVIGNNSPTAGTALSNIGIDGIQNSITIVDQLLTGLTITNAIITATDSILIGLGKAQGQINALSSSSITSVFGRSGPAITAQSGDYSVGQVTGAAPLNSPIFTGTPKAPTQTQGDNDTNLATTAYVDTGLATKEPTITVLPINKGGTGQNTANAAFNALAPSQAGNAGKVLTTDGTDTSWEALSGVSVTSFNSRIGAVVPATGDYTIAQITNGLSNVLNSANIFVGNALNVATPVIPSGAVTINNAGVFTLSSGINALLIAGGGTTNTDFNNLSGTSGNLQSQINALVAGKSFRGAYDASSNLFPSTGGSGSAGAIQMGDYWNITIGGTLGGTPVVIGDLILSLVNAPGQTTSNWLIINTTVASVFGRSGLVVAQTGDYTVSQITGAAPLASPTFTGIPAAPTAAPGTNTTQLATTAFVAAATAAGVTSFNSRIGAVLPTTNDYSFSQISGTALANQGGTGFSSFAIGDMFYANTTSTLTKLALGPANAILTSNGATGVLWRSIATLSAIALTNNVNQITLGTTNTTTITQATLTGSHTFTLPNADSNPVIPSTAPANQFATGINSGGVISYAAPTNALALTTTSLTSSVNGVVSNAVQVSPSAQSITSSISFTNLDEIILLASSVNAIGTYQLQLKGTGQELNIIFTISGNTSTSYNYSTMDIITVTDTTGNITKTNLSNFILFRGYVKNNAPNNYFAVTFSMPAQLIYTNPLSMTVWQYSASYLNENTTITNMITTSIGNLVSLAAPDLSFRMKVETVTTTISNPQGYLYVPAAASNAIFQYSINSLTGALTALSPASFALSSAYKIGITPLRNYLYAVTGSGTTLFQQRINATNGTLSALSPASVTTTNTATGVVVDPTGRFLYVCGFGTGLFGQYTITASTGQLVSIASAPTAAGGMQDLVVHPSGKWLYAVNNVTNTLYQYSINQSTGALTALAIPTIATGTSPIEIIVHPSGSYVYVSNNGTNTISQYSVDSTTGQLTALGTPTFTAGAGVYGLAISNNGLFIYYGCSGANILGQSTINTSTGVIGTPTTSVSIASARDCCLDYSGSFVYVYSSTTTNVTAYSINQSTGAMTLIGTVASGTNSSNMFAV